VYMGGASDQPAGEANPFKPRGMADKLMVETCHLEQIAEQQTAAIKYRRRSVRALLKQKPAEGPTDGVVDLTKATSAATTTRTVIMTHTKDSSFDRISLEEKMKQHASMIETLQKLKAKGHPVTDQEIFEAESELLDIISSREKMKPSNELVVKDSITATDNDPDEVIMMMLFHLHCWKKKEQQHFMVATVTQLLIFWQTMMILPWRLLKFNVQSSSNANYY